MMNARWARIVLWCTTGILWFLGATVLAVVFWYELQVDTPQCPDCIDVMGGIIVLPAIPLCGAALALSIYLPKHRLDPVKKLIFKFLPAFSWFAAGMLWLIAVGQFTVAGLMELQVAPHGPADTQLIVALEAYSAAGFCISALAITIYAWRRRRGKRGT